ncbi:MAG: YqgE/AlgH family protein [Bacteroidia bacterium]|nr:YqgE/AlgH family protein [Bacteroidia bacterium]MCZ2248311.1 YqgE/AlgH family protein [Bacteroidia bacterium]
MSLNAVQPKKGSILISEPTLRDSFFYRSVVLLTEHNDEGSVGFILNKPLDIQLNTLIKETDDINADIFYGGPVNKENLFYIHSIGKEVEGAMPISKKLYWGGDFTLLKHILQSQPQTINQVRFFIGYSGWEPGQLKMEIEQNSWVVSASFPNDILTRPTKNLWRDTLRNMESEIALLSFFPDNPQLN